MNKYDASSMDIHEQHHSSKQGIGYAELAAGQVLADLDPIESSAFRVFERDHGNQADVLTRELEEAAALAAVALAELDSEPMPADLTVRLQRAAGARIEQIRSTQLATQPGAVRSSSPGAGSVLAKIGSGPAATHSNDRMNALGWFGWMAAAACLALFVSVWRPMSSDLRSTPQSASLADLRNELQARPGTLVAQWQDVFADVWPAPEAAGVEGDVVWSPQEQTGYLRLSGLPVNDPSKEQYQLWVVDAERGLEQRIDGGVFDVTASGEVIVPIDPRIPVGSAMAFAITIEQPGGVVVSDMTRRGPIALMPQG
jgi:anti-sigma-K factor RskA